MVQLNITLNRLGRDGATGAIEPFDSFLREDALAGALIEMTLVPRFVCRREDHQNYELNNGRMDLERMEVHSQT